MAKPEPWRLAPETYPFSTQFDTRFQDMDIMGHINNVATAGMFETARIRFHRHLGRHPQDKGVRWLVAAVSLNFVQEAHFPKPIEIRCGIGHIGNTSWTISSAAFQADGCIATCDTVVVTHGAEGRRTIDESIRSVMEENFIRQP